ncbi:hypothetical protein H1R20_g5113, partial [Candolleomyces eurysporus]
MPRSKRSKLVSLTQVSKKTREHKNALIEEVQANADKYRYCWLFGVGSMRNTHLKTVRKLWKDSARIFFGRGAVMAKGIGTTPEEEHKPGLHKLAQEFRRLSANYNTKGPQKNEVPNTLPGIDVANTFRTSNAGNTNAVARSCYQVICLQETNIEPLKIPLEKGGDIFWLDERTVANVIEGDNGAEIYALDVHIDSQSTEPAVLSGQAQLIGTFPTKTPANFRYVSETSLLVFSENVYEDGNLTHWDEWQSLKRPQLFSVPLLKGEDKKWSLGDSFYSPLRGTGHYSPVEPFGGTDDYDVSRSHIVYTCKDPELPEAWHTKQNVGDHAFHFKDHVLSVLATQVYLVDIKGDSPPRELTSGKQGAVHAPVFSKAGSKVAWLELDEDGYESDRAKIVIYDLGKNSAHSTVQFSRDDSFIYLTAGDEAKVKIFALPVPPTPSESSTYPTLDAKYTTPVPLTHSQASSTIHILPNDRLLFTQSSFTSPNDVFIFRDLKAVEGAILNDETAALAKVQPSRLTHFTKADLEGKHMSEGEEFWFIGANKKKVQGWLLKPKGWAPGQIKKWPAVLLIHGGPQGAWEDQWSNRWNPNGKSKKHASLMGYTKLILLFVVFANQGFFVVLINPTGSTTFGQEFTDAIAEDWGGKPFVDMANGWKYILEKYPEIDPERGVAAGASWGGYAINWIQGHPEFGFNFKACAVRPLNFSAHVLIVGNLQALVCHDGVFDSNYNGYSTDELFFFNHEWGGRPWEAKARKLNENPANFVDQWATPQLLIHGSKDYRLPETEGIAAFHALQQRGVPSRLVIFPDENHWVLKHGNSLKWHFEVLRWFDQFVGEDGRSDVSHK